MSVKPIVSGTALLSLLMLSGCVGQAPPKVAAIPPPPQPAVVKPPDESPISYIQNVAVLPPRQLIPVAALPPLDPPPQIVERRTGTETEATPRHRGQTTAAAASHKPPEPLIVPPAGAPAPPVSAAVTPTRPPMRLAEQNAPPHDAVVSKINDVRASAERLSTARLTVKQNRTFKRVTSFIKLAEQALARGELMQASELADRAASLARALTGDN